MPSKDDPVSTKPLVDKLGVKPGARVVVLGVDDPAFWTQLEARTGDITTRPRKDCDVIVLQADALAQLKRLPGLAACIRQDGAIWVAHPRGRKDLRDVEVIAAGKAAGLVDNKVCRFSDTHSALRFVIPLARRKPGLRDDVGTAFPIPQRLRWSGHAGGTSIPPNHRNH